VAGQLQRTPVVLSVPSQLLVPGLRILLGTAWRGERERTSHQLSFQPGPNDTAARGPSSPQGGGVAPTTVPQDRAISARPAAQAVPSRTKGRLAPNSGPLPKGFKATAREVRAASRAATAAFSPLANRRCFFDPSSRDHKHNQSAGTADMFEFGQFRFPMLMSKAKGCFTKR
jgi:hypothetical protein